MSDDALRELFATTERNGRRVPPDAELVVEHFEGFTQVTAAVNVRGRREHFAFQIAHAVAVRSENETAQRDPADIAAQVRKSVISLAYATIDSIPPQRPRARPFVARSA